MADHIRWARTERGFRRGDFQDLYDKACSIQQSSLADQEAIWLGTDGDRMHLDRGHAAELATILQHFADTGQLPNP